MLKVIHDEEPRDDKPNDKLWYAEGLRFKCTECGQCCTGAPGYVYVNEDEIEKIAAFLGIDTAEFSKLYLRRVNGRISLIEIPKTYGCIFLKDKKCQIYSVRPTQCKTFPWWPRNLKSKEEWQEAAIYCEGISPCAPLVSFETIQEQRAMQEGVIK